MSNLEGKIVKFIAIERKYRAEPYQAVAPLDSKLNTYITGQHVDFNDPSTKGNLTLQEITGEVEIKPEGRKRKFPIVISETDVVLIQHNKPYNCKVEDGNPLNAKEYAEAHFIVAQEKLVAPNKDSIMSWHKFYLEDKDEEAKAFVSKADRAYEAEHLIRSKATIGDYKSIVMMLNLTVPGFNIDYKIMSETRLKALLIQQAKENPDSIIKSFSDEGKDYLFIAELLDAKIISHKVGDGYYDGNKFLAAEIPSLIAFMNDAANSSSLGKFGKLLKASKE